MARLLMLGLAVGLTAGACAGSKHDTNTPEGCFGACEEECPGKGSSGANFEKYIGCVERCQNKCGVEPDE